MRIRRYFVTNYKNLVDCEVRPQLIHALTGCNGSGKSNLLEVFSFISRLIAGSDAERTNVFSGLGAMGEENWIPARFLEKNRTPTESDFFRFELEAELVAGETTWVVNYSIAFAPFEKFERPNLAAQLTRIATEVFTAKEMGKPGKSKTLIERIADGTTTVSYTDSRSRPTFQAQGNLSVLKILEIREPENFAQEFPIIFSFRDAILATDLVQLNPAKLIEQTAPDSSSPFQRVPGALVDHFAPFRLLKSLKDAEDKTRWSEFKGWMKTLCDVDDVNLFEIPFPKIPGTEAKEASHYNFIFLVQSGRTLHPAQLSTGHQMIFGLLTALFSFLHNNGAVFLEEPESNLHPKAIVDLLKALRVTSDRVTVLLSTHSPVLLNEMKPEEVTLLAPTKDVGYYTTVSVNSITDAVAQLARGYVSLGEMLETNFTTDADK